MITVSKWTGREVKALRAARRMTLAQLAKTLGVDESMVSRWETRGETITPRAVNQQALDHLLLNSTIDAQERFAHATGLVIETPEDGPLLGQHQMRHPVDGRPMALIPSGVYLSGEENRPAYLQAFFVDVFPVTNSDYLHFVQATGHRAPEHWQGGRPDDAIRDHPVVWVSQLDASSYAQWAKKFLLSATQWEKAARGPKGRVYPWGDTPSLAKINCRESGVGATSPVERYHSGVSPYGVYDMCGNVWEWTSTATNDNRFQLKGSAFTSPFMRCAPATFNDAAETMMDDDTGFRCACPA